MEFKVPRKTSLSNVTFEACKSISIVKNLQTLNEDIFDINGMVSDYNQEYESKNFIPEYMTNLEKILCFLQLLCENHNLALQNFLREQTTLKTKYNLVEMTMEILDILCGGTTGGLGLIGLYINEINVKLVAQCIKTLTEYCQGPCHENQVIYKILIIFIEFYCY